MSKPLSLLLIAPIVEPPREGINKRTGRRWANVVVGGQMGNEFIKLSISLPEDLEIDMFKLHQVWQWPLMLPQSGDDRRMFFRLRNDGPAAELLRLFDDQPK